MNKVFLVSPSLQPDVQQDIIDNSYGLGLGYLHAVIEQAGYDITTRCLNNTAIDDARRQFDEACYGLQPDFLLVQIFTMNRVEAFRAIRRGRELQPQMKIIVGGVHASIYYQQLLENFPIDYIIVGEGEHTIVELLDALRAGTATGDINGIACLRDGIVVATPDRPLLADLDSLPFPRHDLFMTRERSMACILTSRGCPFKCSFCCLYTISKRKYRVRSVENVVAEVEYIIANFPAITTIQISDDTFTLNQKRAIDFCKEIVQRNIRIQFTCSARVKPASRELFEWMERAGFVSIGFGLETGSERLMQSIHKNVTQEDVVRAFEMLKGSKMSITTFLMVGFPGETFETVEETIRFVKRLQKIKYYEFQGVARLWVYPNTEVYDIMKAAGAIDDGYWLTDADVPYFTVENSMEDLDRMVARISLGCMTWRQAGRRLIAVVTNPVNSFREISVKIGKLKTLVRKNKKAVPAESQSAKVVTQ
jgi:anaerobic magnesium-protoporphyrin IX monomethyl ester cyclase